MTESREDLTRRMWASASDLELTDSVLALMFQRWWVNYQEHGGFRLTQEGYHILRDNMDMPCWTLNLTSVTPRILLALDQKLTTPYYLDVRKRKIVMFGSQEAMMATLHGDLDRYLNLTHKRHHD